MLNFENVLKEIKMSVTESIPQTNLFTNSHKKVRITIKYNNKSYSSYYQCNAENYKKQTREELKKDFIWCIYMDSKSYEFSRDFKDFCEEFGYEIYNEDYYGYNKEAQRIYKACKRAYENMITLFSEEEKEAMEEYYREY